LIEPKLVRSPVSAKKMGAAACEWDRKDGPLDSNAYAAGFFCSISS
jgi:hypothetical protein